MFQHTVQDGTVVLECPGNILEIAISGHGPSLETKKSNEKVNFLVNLRCTSGMRRILPTKLLTPQLAAAAFIQKREGLRLGAFPPERMACL